MPLLRPCALLLLALATARAQPATPSWIWLDDGRPGLTRPEDEAVRFRRRFHLEEKASAATLRITADDRFVVRLDGERLGRGRDWRRGLRHRFAGGLEAGDHLLEIAAANDAGPAGLLLRLEFMDAAGRHEIVSDTAFEARAAGLPDAPWTPARRLAPAGEGPWGQCR